MPTYLLIIRTMIPVYDICVILKQDIYHDITQETMIKIGKNEYFHQVNKCFRDGVQECTGIEFIIEKLETYDDKYYKRLWETCDTRVTYTFPNGPAILQIYDISFSKENRENTSPLDKTLIYSLPKQTTTY
ncbi:unnamed protein product [Cunninghamella echinulata]